MNELVSVLVHAKNCFERPLTICAVGHLIAEEPVPVKEEEEDVAFEPLHVLSDRGP